MGKQGLKKNRTLKIDYVYYLGCVRYRTMINFHQNTFCCFFNKIKVKKEIPLYSHDENYFFASYNVILPSAVFTMFENHL